MTKQRSKIFIFLASMVLALPAGGVVGTDLLVTGYSDDFNFRSHSYAFISLGDSFRIGPVVGFDRPQDRLYEMMAGLGFMFGKTLFFELDFGVYQRRAKNKYGVNIGRGFASNVGVGMNFGCCFRVSMFAIGRTIRSGSSAQQVLVNGVPLIGFRTKL